MIAVDLKQYDEGDYTFYDFSDNDSIIKSHYNNYEIIEDRIKAFFSGKCRDLRFSDLEDTYFIKK